MYLKGRIKGWNYSSQKAATSLIRPDLPLQNQLKPHQKAS